MKTVQIVKSNELELTDIKKPVITEKDDILIKMTAVEIRGSDADIYHGIGAVATYPRTVGHEMVGRAEEVGPGVANLEVGDGIIINQVTSCGHCCPYKIGRGSVCDSLAVRGVHINGGYREYIAVPGSDCYILPESLPDQDTVMIESTAIGIQSCIRADPERDGPLLTYGSSVLGNSILKIARLFCDHIIVADVVDDKLEAVEAGGATCTINALKENLIEKAEEYIYGHGVIVSTGAMCNKDSPVNLLQTTDSAGRVMTMGFFTASTEINQLLVISEEPDVRGPRPQNRVFGRAVELVNRGKLDLTNSVSHTFPLTKVQEMFDFVDSHDPSIRKVVLTFDF